MRPSKGGVEQGQKSKQLGPRTLILEIPICVNVSWPCLHNVPFLAILPFLLISGLRNKRLMKLQVKRFKICHNFGIRKSTSFFQIFHFVLFFPSYECPGLHRRVRAFIRVKNKVAQNEKICWFLNSRTFHQA